MKAVVWCYIAAQARYRQATLLVLGKRSVSTSTLRLPLAMIFLVQSHVRDLADQPKPCRFRSCTIDHVPRYVGPGLASCLKGPAVNPPTLVFEAGSTPLGPPITK